MKISESEAFRDMGRAMLNYYDEWERTCDKPGTKRGFVGGTNQENTTCLLLFKGTKEDCRAIREFLKKRDKCS